MKIGIAGFSHETITFWPEITGLAEFERVAHHGKDVIEKGRGANSCIGGFIDVLEDLDDVQNVYANYTISMLEK